ncbi:MAG TPA: 50S ribosomal protein L25 [Candidatus Paceibacterota bacterium]|nr:50S ribosomal protein L25 [Candidatus Paceibacterota bacterium]
MNAAQKHKLELEAQERTVVGQKVRRLRVDGLVPAVLYGRGQEALNLQVPVIEFDRVFKEAGESTLVYVKVGTVTFPTIISDVTRDPVSGNYIHADFHKVRLDEKVTAEVPVVFTGVSPAVKEFGGIFVRNVNELEVKAFPQDLPHEITVDISSLKAIDDSITLSQIKLENAEILGNPEDIIATVQPAKTEEELAAELAEPTTDVSAVGDVEKEEAAEEEEGEGEGEAAPEAAPAEEKKEE